MGEGPEKPPPAAVDDLASRTRRFLREIAIDCLKRPLDELLRFALARAVSYLVAAALLITAAVFVLVGGVGGLEEAGVKRWAAYLALGGAALLAGLLVLRAPRPPAK
jgi:hypothetical protein